MGQSAFLLVGAPPEIQDSGVGDDILVVVQFGQIIAYIGKADDLGRFGARLLEGLQVELRVRDTLEDGQQGRVEVTH